MKTKTRRTIGTYLKAKITLNALRKQARVVDPAARYQVHPNLIYAWKKQLRHHGLPECDAKVGPDTEGDRQAACEDRPLEDRERFFTVRLDDERFRPPSEARSRACRSFESAAVCDARPGAVCRVAAAAFGE